MNFLNPKNTCKEQWKIILVHFIVRILFVGNGLTVCNEVHVFQFSL